MKNKKGAYEWGGTMLTITDGCSHSCRYCYARSIAVDRFHRMKDWSKMKVRHAEVDKSRGKYKNQPVFFQSASDITFENINEFCCVLRKLLDAGNEVLIVTKPHWECITLICESFKEFRDKILFRFTIGSTKKDVLAFWEPGAPDFEERFGCLMYAHHTGYRTSVSCEPYLDAFPHYVYEACRLYLTDSFWIGKIRHFNSRVKLDDATPEQIKKYVNPVKMASQNEYIKLVYQILDGQPFIQWKDSIKEVMGI